MSKPQERLKLLGKRLRKTMWHWAEARVTTG